MKTGVEGLLFSATDLANHLACRHLTSLNFEVARGEREVPTWTNPAAYILQLRGFDHEKAYINHLRTQGHTVIELDKDESTAGGAFDRTLAAMRSGVDVIVQATLQHQRWFGRADVLLRVNRPSCFGEWSYEAADCKLSQETKAGTVIQLCLYSEMLGEIQKTTPEFMYVVVPGTGFVPIRYRINDFIAYNRWVERKLGIATDEGKAQTYPDPTPHCEICRWWELCNRRRRGDDHLCFVAGISKLQIQQLREWKVSTLEGLARLPLPLRESPRRGSSESYVRVREQARVQLATRTTGVPVHELLPVEAGRGMTRLPAPSLGDIFLDLEGDQYVGEAGLEYLFGRVLVDEKGNPNYQGLWAFGAEREKAAFEYLVDWIMERWKRHPDLHVYHFGVYEPTALKRLMGYYASREDAVDRMLRAKLLVDLHSIVRQSVRAGVEQYSLKDLEVFHGFQREVPLGEASTRKRALERALELSHKEWVDDTTRAAVESYNRDDCLSAMHLRNWLEELRGQAIRSGQEVPRPAPEQGDPSAAVDARHRRVQALVSRLITDVPIDAKERTEVQQGRWLLAHLLEYDWREDKAAYWEYFRLVDLDLEDYLPEKDAVGGLRFAKRIGGTPSIPIDRYKYPRQEIDIRAGQELLVKVSEHSEKQKTVKLGDVDAIDFAARTIDIKKTGKTRDLHPEGAFANPKPPPSDVLADALFRLGEFLAETGLEWKDSHRVGKDLILRSRPRVRSGAQIGELQREKESVLEAGKRLAPLLDRGVLAIQGPPGSGKTYTAARMISRLVDTKKRVGITAMSHKVIENLLAQVIRAGKENGIDISCVQKVSDKGEEGLSGIRRVTNYPVVLKAIQNGEAQVAAGTTWLWAREEFADAVDVLFVDEAGQMPLARVLAASQGARNLVLLGDPAQLEQPQRGSHPEGTGVSALEHMLGSDKTIPPDRGLFLAETWRLHPSICSFTSEVFYENRLRSRPGLELQALLRAEPFTSSGLWFVPVSHQGNQNSSSEEVDKIAEIVKSLTNGTAAWVNAEQQKQPLGLGDILIVAPYNAQVSDLLERLPNARVGTVDKFQGQEAPVVIYSMTTSSPEEAPRGMEFLYSLNRLNVATSRARCACILVANPRLFEPECRTPSQIVLANALCRYLEMGRIVQQS